MTAPNGQLIKLENVSKSWQDVYAVRSIDLVVEPGTFTVLLGPSGCGKSTTLRIVAGLESADSGSVVIGDEDVSSLPPAERHIAMVFQSYALFPHLTVAENILFGLKVRRIARAQQRLKLDQTAEMLGLTDYLSRKPSQLSGGQQQRVALGRAIIAEKPVCLMDEPLSNLDAKLRNTMRAEIRELQQTLGFSMIYVTHDQSEAITMADQVVLMRDGQIEQAGSPRQIYAEPATMFAAGFIGTPPMNLIPLQVLLGKLDAPSHASRSLSETPDTKNLTIGVRPEHIHPGNENGVEASITHTEYLGADLLLTCNVDGHDLLVRLPGDVGPIDRKSIKLGWSSKNTHLFNKNTGARLTPEESDLALQYRSIFDHTD